MKTKINHILPVLLLTAASGLTTVSCNDFLDKTPDNRTELNTDQKIAKLLVSAYPDVSPNELFELYSDNSDDSGPTYGYYQLSEKECYNWEDTKEEYQDTPNSLWGGYYGAISAANMALKAIEEKGNPASLNPQRGEALVCRAYWKVIGYVRKSVEKKIKHKSFEINGISAFCQVEKMQTATEY